MLKYRNKIKKNSKQWMISLINLFVKLKIKKIHQGRDCQPSRLPRGKIHQGREFQFLRIDFQRLP